MYGGALMSKANEANSGQVLYGLTPRWAALAMLSTLPILILFAYLGELRRGETAWFCTGMIIIALRACLYLRKHGWFWVTAAILAGLHIPLIVFAPWTTTEYPGWALVPVGLLDLGVVYGCIKLVERVMSRSDGASSRT